MLGLALVSEGVNDDDPDTRHFWFGDAQGAPGTLVTSSSTRRWRTGVVGAGSVHHVAFVVESADEQLAWRDYLRDRGVECSEVLDRGAFRSLYLRDPDGHIVEIATRGPGF